MTKAKEPRRHHYVPEFYLAGFTETCERDGRLHLVSVRDGRPWKGTPRTEGTQRDFYRLDDAEGPDSLALETGFAELEGKVGLVFKAIAAEEGLPTDEDGYSLLMTFVAAVSARVPQMREMWDRAGRSLVDKTLSMVVSSERMFEAHQERALRDGHISTRISYETARKSVEEHDYIAGFSQGFHFRRLFQTMDILVPWLGMRQWTLLVAEPGADFVTSDNPVALAWSDGQARGAWPPGFGLPETDVTFPLTRRLALLGRFEGEARTERADRRMVAAVNTRTIKGAGRFVASATEDHIWLLPSGEVARASELFDLLKQRPRRRPTRGVSPTLFGTAGS